MSSVLVLWTTVGKFTYYRSWQQWYGMVTTELIHPSLWKNAMELTFISHVHLNCWPEDVNGTTVGCRSNALSRVTECHRLDLSALLVISVPRSIGSTAAVQSTALPHLHCPVIRTCCKVSLIIAHTNSATNNKCIGCWTEGATYVFATLIEWVKVGWSRV